MAAFRFRLDKVLRYRRRLVDLRSREVAAAELVLAEAAGRVRALQERLAAVPAPDAAGGPLDVRGRLELAAWYARQEKRLARLVEERHEAAAEVARRREDLTAAFRDREVLEKLRQRRREEWQTAEGRRERRELDEIGQQRPRPRGTAIADGAAQVAPRGGPGRVDTTAGVTGK